MLCIARHNCKKSGGRAGLILILKGSRKWKGEHQRAGQISETEQAVENQMQALLIRVDGSSKGETMVLQRTEDNTALDQTSTRITIRRNALVLACFAEGAGRCRTGLSPARACGQLKNCHALLCGDGDFVNQKQRRRCDNTMQRKDGLKLSCRMDAGTRPS